MDRLATFLDMGGYAGFVWPSLILSAAVLVGLLWVSLRQVNAAEAELAKLEAMRPRRGDRGRKNDGNEA